MDNVMQVATKLVNLCREGRHMDAINTLYAKDIVSIEAHGGMDFPARMEGLDAVRGKGQWWMDNHEVHGGQVDGPYPHGDRFIVRFVYDVTPKVGPMKGQRMTIEEAGLYTVRDGKVVQEEFFYHMPG
jgi:ketosteroid isomerase-like protein